MESLNFSESGLPGILFSVLDQEMNSSILSDVHDTLIFILQSTAADNLTTWLSLLREVLTVSNDLDKDAKEEEEEDEDAEEFTVNEDRESIWPRWPTRVFAAECLRKIIDECCHGGNRAHYDLSLAKEMQLSSKNDYLVLHLSQLVRVSFMASTSEADPLRLEGLRTLEAVIDQFGLTPEPEFPGHVILEQYQAQVGAALRPAFSPETPSDVTAAACDVCSAWIGSGVARDLKDLKRVYQLLVSSLDKVRPRQNSRQLYNEAALTLEKLSILKAWAEVYIVSMKNEIVSFHTSPMTTSKENDDFGDFEGDEEKKKEESLASLIQGELPSLSKFWLSALKDHALLSLPPEFKVSSQLF